MRPAGVGMVPMPELRPGRAAPNGVSDAVEETKEAAGALASEVRDAGGQPVQGCP